MSRLYEEVASLIKPAPVVAVSLNTRGLDEEEAEDLIAAVADETGLPTADPFRGSAAPILQAVLEAPKSKPSGTCRDGSRTVQIRTAAKSEKLQAEAPSVLKC